MRKQTKIAAIASAAALLAIGASLTATAAVRGTWRMGDDGEWMCYDRNGDAYTDTFAVSNGIEYYLGDDGLLVRSSWVENEGYYYFTNSTGAKITNDWRLTTPYDDDEADEEWFYFGSNGRRAENKKVTWKGETYFLDSEGKMLTGWVTSSEGDSYDTASSWNEDAIYYCDEVTGARVQRGWIYAPTPETQDEEEDAEYYYYYLKSSGKAATGRQGSINGQTYFFDDEGHMLIGWVGEYYTESKSNAKKHYTQLYDYNEDDSSNFDMTTIADFKANDSRNEVYWCDTTDDGIALGHVKKNKWIETWAPEDIENEEDGDQEYFWLQKDGKVFTAIARESATNAQAKKFEDGSIVNDGDPKFVDKKAVSGKDYWFDTEGRMVSGFYDIYNERFYFGSDGAMRTGSQSIADDAGDVYKFYFNTKDVSYKDVDYTEENKLTHDHPKGSGVTGAKNGKLYSRGKLMTADDYKYETRTITVDGGTLTYIINANGSIQTRTGEYKEDGDVLFEVKAPTHKDENGKDVTEQTFYRTGDGVPDTWKGALIKPDESIQ